MKVSDNIKYGIVMCFLHLFAILPLWVLYVMSDFFALLAHYVIRYRLKVVRKNLSMCYPDKTKRELRHIERKFYRYLCDVFVETVKLLHISDSQLRDRVKVSNPELVSGIASCGQPVILFLAHYCNWEWVPALTLSVDAPKRMGALYKPLRNKVMNRVALRLRSRFKSECIPVKNAYRQLIGMKETTPSFMIGFIADQRALGVSVKHWTDFMGQRTSFYAGGETIGDRIGARFVYLDVKRLSRGHYLLTFKDIIPEGAEPDFPYTRTFFDMLEQTVNEAPAYWLWSHNRWKEYHGKI